MAYQVTWEPEGVRCVFTSDFSTEDLLESNREIAEDPRFPSIRYSLHDFSAIKNPSVDSTAIREVSYTDVLLQRLNPHLKLALVANHAVMKGLINMFRKYYELHAGDEDEIWDVRFFEDIAEAEKWVQGSGDGDG